MVTRDIMGIPVDIGDYVLYTNSKWFRLLLARVMKLDQYGSVTIAYINPAYPRSHDYTTIPPNSKADPHIFKITKEQAQRIMDVAEYNPDITLPYELDLKDRRET